MEIFFTVITLSYFLLHIILFRGILNSFRLEKSNVEFFPKVSVIVAGRNEESNIGSCIKSLSKSDYPVDSFEIILVNDNSDDNTFNVMSEASKDFPFFKVINSHKNTSENLKGKANAIDNAIDICTGEIILMTDADCEVPPDWIRNTVKFYNTDTGMVCGFTLMKESNKIISILQTLDWLYLLALASSSSGLNKILSCIGNNLSFTKKAYSESGGYKSIKFSVTEDLALMRKIDSDKKYKVVFPIDSGCLVKTKPCADLKEVFSQKRRWFRGGTDVNFLGYIVGAELYLMNILLVTGIFFLNFKIYLILILLKTFSELILLFKLFREFRMQAFYKYYPLFLLYFAFTGLLLPLSFLFGKKINWKGRKF